MNSKTNKYTEIITFDLYKKLKEVGAKFHDQRLKEVNIPTYGDVIDWFISKGYSIEICVNFSAIWTGQICKVGEDPDKAISIIDSDDWFNCADKTIEYAINLLKK